MTALEPSGPNAEQIKYWNERGHEWVAQQALIDSQIRPLGVIAMERAAITAGERVLDVGCGCGDATLEIAQRVGSTGIVTGIDISTVMLERAHQAAQQAGVTNARFENADAQTHAFPAGRFDLLYSRFGVMFFTDPTAAFANLRGALRRGGRVAFVCWQPFPLNAWMFVPFMAALQYVAPPPPPAPDAPGPASFGDPERVRRILTGAGFTDLGFESVTETLTVGGGAGIDATITFLLQLGPTAAVLREVDDATRVKVRSAMRDALTPYLTADGVRMGSAAWIVTARRP